MKSSQIYICSSDVNVTGKQLSCSINFQCSAKSLAENEQPALTILLVDESATLNDGNFKPSRCGGADVPTSIHLEGFSAAYTERHVKWKRPNSLTKNDFRFKAIECL